MIALDGEREVGFGEDDEVRIVLEPDAVRTVDVKACMDYAARNGLFRVDGPRGQDARSPGRASPAAGVPAKPRQGPHRRSAGPALDGRRNPKKIGPSSPTAGAGRNWSPPPAFFGGFDT